ncbi:FecR family protein [Pedobacter sp. ok626]|uniref:FecR family protein n=1 Tax=Pedobacter sp. ok626 TaxID=1761882 RepID=UPI000886C4D8|nr:FecR family protein [Pedobacter sp. ok626]SDL97765.1 FecR family protein [Pedobacter sp. ok626]
MNASQLKKLLTAFLKNRLNKTDRNLLQNWYDSFGESEKGVPGINNAIDEDFLRQDLLNRIQVQLNQPDRPIYKLNTFRNIAASIVLVTAVGMASWFFVFKSKQDISTAEISFQTVATTSRQLKKVILPDNSVVHLNANSRIRIPHHFSKKDRQFYLEEGEAFFQVAKDKTRPFIIHSQQLEIRVLGTSFNIRSYKQLADIKVAVTTGKVSVSEQGKIYGILIPGQQITYHKAKKTIQLSKVVPTDNDAWVNGKIYLEKAGFEELALAMHNIYGVTLRNEVADNHTYQYNLTIRSDRSLEETMKLICAIHGHNFKKRGHEILIR